MVSAIIITMVVDMHCEARLGLEALHILFFPFFIVRLM